MKLGIPFVVDGSTTVSGTVAEDDYAEWNSVTTYAADDYVIVIGTTHKVYQSVQGSNLNHDPTTDDGTWWTEIGATNRWKVFDGFLSDQMVATDLARYFIEVPAGETWASVGLFNVEASDITVSVQNEEGAWDLSVTPVNVTWTRNSTDPSAPDPIYPGLPVGSMVEQTTVTTNHYLRSTSPFTLAAGEVWTAVVYVQASASDNRRIQSEVFAGGGDRFYAVFDVVNDQAVDATFGVDSSGLVDMGGGWWKCWFTFTCVTPSSSFYHYVYLKLDGSLGSYSGSGGTTLWIYRPMLTQEADKDDVGIISWETKQPGVSAAVADWYEGETGVALDLVADDTWLDPDIFTGFTALEGYVVTVAAENAGDVKIGQIVPTGTLANIGATTTGTGVTSQDFSTKDVDQFGYGTFVQRGFSREIEYAVSLETTEIQRSIQLFNQNRATPVVWVADTDSVEFGAVAYGWWDDYSIRVEETRSAMTVNVKGLS